MGRKNRWFFSSDFRRKKEELKLYLCHSIKRVVRKRNWNQREAAFRMGTTASRVSHVDRLKLNKLTIKQLFQYLINIAPHFEILIST